MNDIALPKLRKNISSGEDVILARDMAKEEQDAVAQWDEYIAEHEEMDSWYVGAF